jgi:hypothetical protein
MEMVYLDERKAKDDFAVKAAKHFERNPDHWTYTEEEIAPNVYFALRFGLGNDCVVVFRIGDEMPTNYQNII